MVQSAESAKESSRLALYALSALICASIVVRGFFAWMHSTPRYFPDEYIYAALGRSLAHGHYAIRGATTHFPGALQPVVAAPLWGLFSIPTAYHLIQVENAVFASLASLPVYFLARRLRLPVLYSLLCALYALVIPALVWIPYTMADILAYPLALFAVLAGLNALEDPTRRHQLAFLASATLASLARIEYFVFIPAYLVTALALERREVLRRHRVALIALAPVALATLAGGIGYYRGGIAGIHLNPAYLRWLLAQAFLMTLITGVVMVPGAVAGLLRPAGRREAAFALFAGSFAILLLAEATVYALGSGRFKERYLFALLPLVPVAFGLYLKNRRPGKYVVIALAVAVALAAARVPLSGYTPFTTDSQFFFAIKYFEPRIGVDTTSLVVAVLATLGAAAAVAVAFRGFDLLAPIAGIAVATVVTVIAVHVDLIDTDGVRSGLPQDRGWIDNAARGTVTVIATPVSSRTDLFNALYWNETIQGERVLDHAVPSDAFSAPDLQLGRSGTLDNVRGDFLFDNYGTTGTFANAERIVSIHPFTLWRPQGTPRLRLLIEGRFADQWLSPFGRIRVWPLQANAASELSFRLSLPPDWHKIAKVKVANRYFTIKPGRHLDVTCRSGQSGRVDTRFSSSTIIVQPDFRRFVVRLSQIRLADEDRGELARAARGLTLCRPAAR